MREPRKELNISESTNVSEKKETTRHVLKELNVLMVKCNNSNN